MNSSDADEDETVSARDLRRVGAFLSPFLKAHCGGLALLAAVLLLETAANVGFALAERFLIDQGLVLRQLHIILGAVGLLGLAAVLASLFGLGIDYLASRIAVGIVGDIREDLFAHSQTLNLSYFERTPHGETLSRFAGDVGAIEQALLEAASWLFLPALQIAYSMALIFYFNLWLGCVAALMFPVLLILPRYFARATMQAGYDKRVCEAGLLAGISENIALQPVMRAFGHAARARAALKHGNDGWRRIAFKSAFWGALVQRSAFSGLYILHVGVFALGAWIVYSGRMSLGTLIVFEVLFLSAGESVAYVMDYVPRFAAAAGGLHHIEDLLNAWPEPEDLPGAQALPPLQSEVRYDGVGFTYVSSGFAVGPVTLTIRRGMKVALVGPSGCGKSSLLNLLLRFRDPSDGAITLDGRDIRHVTLTSLRARIGFVPQSPMLFAASIHDNIALGDMAVSQTRIEQAAGDAGIAPYIASLKDGYRTRIGEAGSGLSVGQRQRLCIARALVRDPDILLLDEPTSALDAATGDAIMQTLWRAGANRTVICATHNMAQVEGHVDMVVVMQNGMVRDIRKP